MNKFRAQQVERLTEYIMSPCKQEDIKIKYNNTVINVDKSKLAELFDYTFSSYILSEEADNLLNIAESNPDMNTSVKLNRENNIIYFSITGKTDNPECIRQVNVIVIRNLPIYQNPILEYVVTSNKEEVIVDIKSEISNAEEFLGKEVIK